MRGASGARNSDGSDIKRLTRMVSDLQQTVQAQNDQIQHLNHGMHMANCMQHAIRVQGEQMHRLQYDMHHTVAGLQRTITKQSEEIEAHKEEIQQLQESNYDLRLEVMRLQRWEYMEYLNIPRSYWTNACSMSESSADAMEQFMISFKDQMYTMRSLGNSGSLSLSIPDGVDGNVFSFERVMEYWVVELHLALTSPRFRECNAFAESNPRALCASDSKKDRDGTLSLCNLTLNYPVISSLAPGLEKNRFKKIMLQKNFRYGRDGIRFAMDLIEQNPTLEEFCLEKNPIDNSDDASRLCDVIKHHPSLKHVAIRESGSRDASILCPILLASNNLTSINLENNRISGLGDTRLSEFLAKNPSLEKLHLGGNHWNDDDAAQIANALKDNTTLQYVDLGMENMALRRAGKMALIKAVFDPRNLNSIAHSNHTCWVRVFPTIRRPGGGGVIVDGLEIPCINDSTAPNPVRKMKLLAYLSAPYEASVNVHCLADVPLEIMPEVLELVQQYPEVKVYGDGEDCPDETWQYMAQLRPDTPQNEWEYEANNAENAERENGIGRNEVGEEGDRDPFEEEFEYWGYYREVNPKPAQIKRLCMVYGIMRGWKLPTGEPLYLQASSFR